MKYYDEKKMVEIRRTFETEVMKWKGVTSRPMMGCLCYFYNRKFIGFLVTNGIVLMKLSEKDQTLVMEKFGGKPFEMAGKTGRLWVTPLKSPKDVGPVMSFVRRRYEEVSSRAKIADQGLKWAIPPNGLVSRFDPVLTRHLFAEGEVGGIALVRSRRY